MTRFMAYLFSALLVTPYALAQSGPEAVSGFTQAELTSQDVYSIPDGAVLHLYRAMGPGLALWVRRTDGIDVYLSSTGTIPFKGYYVHGLGETASRFFAQPSGDMMIAAVGESVEGNYIYWSPDLGEGKKDFSDNLLWSADGSVAAMASYEDGNEYAYSNDQRFGPYKTVFSHFPTADNDLLYVAITLEGDIRVFRNGVDLSGPLPDAQSAIVEEAEHGNGYLYGVDRASGFWLLHNDRIIEGSDAARVFRISPDGASYAYLRDVDNTVEAVVNGAPTGNLFTASTAVNFSRDGQSYAMLGVRKAEDGTETRFFEVNGTLTAPIDGGVMARFHFAGMGGGAITYGYTDGGQDHLFFGGHEIGSFPSGSVSAPETSDDGSQYVYFSTGNGQSLLQTATRAIPLDNRDVTGALFVMNNGDVHFNIEDDGSYIRMFNTGEIGRFDNITWEDLAEVLQDVSFVGVTAEGQTLYRNNIAVVTADRVLFAYFAEIAGRERLVARIDAGGKEYLVVDGEIAGPFDEVLLYRNALLGKPPQDLVFHSRTGDVISRHRWPL